MNTYDTLTIENKRLEQAIKANKRHLNRTLIRDNKGFIRFLDVLVVLAILFNFLALGITNLLVMKAEPDRVLMEANPVQAKMNDYELHPDWHKPLLSFIRQVLIWSVLSFFYIYQRRSITEEIGLYSLTFMAVYLAVITYADFINNFGYYIGRLIFI